LLNGITCGDALTGLLPALKAEIRQRSEPVGQDREGLAARTADSTSHPNLIVMLVVSLAELPSMADDRLAAANRTSPRQKVQWDYPGSMLSFASGSAIKIITAGVKAATDRPCQVSI
jgi:hypothetical protein